MNPINKTIAAVLVFGALFAGNAQALLLGGVGIPDIKATALDVDYSASTDLFRVTGHEEFGFVLGGAASYNDGTVHDIQNGTDFYGLFDFALEITAAGVIDNSVTDGLLHNLVIEGRVDGIVASDTVLLTAKALEFGEDGSDLQFRLEVTGGALAPQFGNVGGTIGFKLLNANGDFNGDFSHTADAFGQGGATADVFVEVPRSVPVPMPLALLFVGLIGVARAARRAAC